MNRPVIGFLTDFGSDSAAAICRGVMLGIVRDAQIVDIDHGVRKFSIGDGAFLLWAALPWLPLGTHLAVVDPGVGTDRRPVAIKVGRGDVLVGPDNGLLIPTAERLGGVTEARVLENAELMLSHRSSTFHGRDVFAPVTAHLAAGTPFEAVGSRVEPSTLTGHSFPAPRREGEALLAEVLYVDSFGNIRLSATPDDLGSVVQPSGSAGARTGARTFVAIEPGDGGSAARVGSGGRGPDWTRVPLVRTFGEVDPGSALLYEDSNGLLAIGINQGDAGGALALATGASLRLRGVGAAPA